MDRHQEHLRALARSADDIVRQRGLDAVKAEVVFIIDVSRSMYPMYRAKLVQEVATQLLALSLSFDDDGIIPAYAFGERSRHLGDLSIRDFPGYIDREVIRTGEDYQRRCLYAPVIDDVCRYYFPEDWGRSTLERTVGRVFKRTETVYPRLSRPRTHPVFAIVVTSGDCEDREATADAIRRSSRLPIFWQFIGLSPPEGKRTRFRFLRKLDRLGNTHVDNCGFFEPTDVWDAGSLYDGMLNEFPTYLRLPQVLRMVRPPEEGGLTTRGPRLPEDELAGEPLQDTAAVDDRSPAAPAALGPRAAERARKMSATSHEDKIDLLHQKIEQVRFTVQHTNVGASPRPEAHVPRKHMQDAKGPASIIIDDLWDDRPGGSGGEPGIEVSEVSRPLVTARPVAMDHSSVNAVFAALDAASPPFDEDDDTDLGQAPLAIPPIPHPPRKSEMPPLPPRALGEPDVTRVGSLEAILEAASNALVDPATQPPATRPPLPRPATKPKTKPKPVAKTVHTRTALISLDPFKDDITEERDREVDAPVEVSREAADRQDATSRLQAIRERRRRRRKTGPGDDL